MAKKKGKKNKGRKTFEVKTRGNNGKDIKQKSTAKKYSGRKLAQSTRQSINKAAIKKFGSRKQASKKGATVSKKTQFKDLSKKQKASIGVKGKVDTTKELNRLREAIGYKVDRNDKAVGSIRFAIHADKQRGKDLSREYKNKPTADVISKLTTNQRRVDQSKDTLKALRRNKGNGALEAADLGLQNQFGELQGQVDSAINRINNYEPDAALQNQLKNLQGARQADRQNFNSEIGNLNTMINNLQMNTVDLVDTYEGRMADDRDAYNNSLNSLRDAYTLQEAQTTRMNEIYADQQRRSQNLRRAYVPSSNQVAGNPMVGDRRKGRKAADRKSALSSLTISTGLGRNANPLAGLQLA